MAVQLAVSKASSMVVLKDEMKDVLIVGSMVALKVS